MPKSDVICECSLKSYQQKHEIRVLRDCKPKFVIDLNVPFTTISSRQLRFRPVRHPGLSAPQNDHLNFSFVKDIHVSSWQKMTRKGRKMVIYQSQILVYSL